MGAELRFIPHRTTHFTVDFLFERCNFTSIGPPVQYGVECVPKSATRPQSSPSSILVSALHHCPTKSPKHSYH